MPSITFITKHNQRTRPVPSLAFLFFFFLCLIAQNIVLSNAQAATITVTNGADDGTNCTLREAIENTNASVDQNNGCTIDISSGDLGVNDTIEFDSAITTNNIFISGELLINRSVSINPETTNSGLRTITIRQDSNSNSRVINITRGDVQIDRVHITNGKPDDHGGGVRIQDGGSLTLSNSTVSENEVSLDSSDSGGGIAVFGNLSLINSTISNNGTFNNGGGIATFDFSTVNIINSTISNNSASFSGAAIDMSGDSIVDIINTTMSGNQALFGGGIDVRSRATVNLTNTIIANPIRGGDLSVPSCRAVTGSVNAGPNNIIEDDNCGTTAIDIDPLLGPLTNNGGPTLTHALSGASPAIRSRPVPTNTSTPETDQRSFRINDERDIGAFEFGASLSFQLTVNSTADTTPSQQGVNDGDTCTLREAIATINAQANLNNGCVNPDLPVSSLSLLNDTIILDPTVTGDTIVLTHAQGGQLEISQSVIIRPENDDSSQLTTINANRTGRAINLTEGTAQLERLLITGGSLVNNGGGIFIRSGATLNLVNSAVSGNSANELGGGIFVDGSATTQVKNSTIANNTTLNNGGGIAGSGTARLSNSTISGNEASNIGGGIFVDSIGSVSLRNSTISNNAAVNGGGVFVANNSEIILDNSIIADSISTSDCAGAGVINANSDSIIEDGSCATSALALDPQLGLLEDNGGPTLTHALLEGSPAIRNSAFDQGAADQRGFQVANQRDIGAFEFGAFRFFLLEVNSTEDQTSLEQGVNDANICTLREAIDIVNAQTVLDNGCFNQTIINSAPSILGDTITFGPTVEGGTITLGTPGQAGAITIRENVIINPDSTNSGSMTTINQTRPFSRGVLQIRGHVQLHQLLITGGAGDDRGSAGGGNSGGGITVRSDGILELNNSTVSGNQADNGGGGIFVEGGTLTLNNSVISANEAISDSGGGIFIGGELSIVTINNSTISENTANYSGGGVKVTGSSTVILNDSTVSGNNSVRRSGGGIDIDDNTVIDGSSVTLNNTTVSDNLAPSGGGISIDNTRTGKANILELSNSVISNNTASSATQGGGGVNIGANNTVTITNSAIVDNSSIDDGGGILSWSIDTTVNVLDSTISNNSTQTNGGGIYYVGLQRGEASTFNVTNSTISNNSAKDGGGIFTFVSTNNIFNISNSTISNNTVEDEGGGIYISDSNNTFNISNSTISNNSSQREGGGIFVLRSASIVNASNSTISGNSSGNNRGGGISTRNGAPVVNLSNSIVANSVGRECFTDTNSTFTGTGNNIIEDGTCDVSNTIAVDPLLGPLADNGGTTLTHALLSGSPAIDAAGAEATNIDQRGIAAVGTRDLGAYEIRPLTLSLTSNRINENGSTTAAVTRSSAIDNALSVTISSSEPNIATAATTSVLIPAGEESATFTINAINDDIITNNRNTTIEVSAIDFDSARAELRVIEDDDPDGDNISSAADNCPSVTNVNQPDLDGDGLGDVCDSDQDGDGLPNAYEIANGLDPRNFSDGSSDPDGDGFTNLQEFEFGTDPNIADADEDNNGIPDTIQKRRILPVINLLLLDTW